MGNSGCRKFFDNAFAISPARCYTHCAESLQTISNLRVIMISGGVGLVLGFYVIWRLTFH